ncbi:MAG TPA: bifunctional phosphoribosylaminoimidazolecarboxamide formyltransferase/inosine monophosphate cyclohydrolase, partial [Erythrobacter sp.]|nr:bifunctional phosphoribosylaminoimidazolecarboxamide formyltransferase/inosine monophosphate cyclohydrolase [Erythrobacter sp.]
MADVAIKRALLSVSDKSGLVELGEALAARGVELVSTGGTARALREAGLDVRDVSDLTGFPEMMDGRVKTLHPMVHGGLLAVRDNPEHAAAMEAHAIGAIDLVVVNLYPFEATVAKGAGRDEIIENIDIGGPSMVRSAAKNHQFVTIVTDPADYPALLGELEASGATSLDFRRQCAAKAFAATAAYDSMISQWFAFADQQQRFPQFLAINGKAPVELRYGENPHQQAALYTPVGPHAR